MDIALEIGYDSHEGFTKSFKKMYDKTPSEYRRTNQNRVMCLGELVDESVVQRFICDNPDFKLVDETSVIEYLLEKDFKRYGYFCTTIKCCGLKIVAENGDFKQGFIGIEDDLKGGYNLQIQTEDFSLLVYWLKKFPQTTTFYSSFDEETVVKELQKAGLKYKLKVTPRLMFFGDNICYNLPDEIKIRKLTVSDKSSIIEWADGKRDGYIQHLLNEQHYLDENVLDYGVFENKKLIAVAGCGIDEVMGLKLNNCCNIQFLKGKETNDLYRNIYGWIAKDIIRQGGVPFDDIQHGDYAHKHGNFTSLEIGFEVTDFRYDLQ